MKNFNAVIFDMDGVLIDARDWHYWALNEALEPFGIMISESDHNARFNGLSTARKLDILTEELNLPRELHAIISTVKQDRTLRLAAGNCYPSISHQILLNRLKLNGIKIGLVTNSVRETTEFMLKSAGLLKLFDCIITNQDVLIPKPNPEGYIKAMKNLGIRPEQTLVVEDGNYGKQAAEAAGCTVVMVDAPKDVNLELLCSYIPELTF
jgi:beta-phosphoglucomutase